MAPTIKGMGSRKKENEIGLGHELDRSLALRARVLSLSHTHRVMTLHANIKYLIARSFGADHTHSIPFHLFIY